MNRVFHLHLQSVGPVSVRPAHLKINIMCGIWQGSSGSGPQSNGPMEWASTPTSPNMSRCFYTKFWHKPPRHLSEKPSFAIIFEVHKNHAKKRQQEHLCTQIWKQRLKSGFGDKPLLKCGSVPKQSRRADVKCSLLHFSREKLLALRGRNRVGLMQQIHPNFILVACHGTPANHTH